MLILTAIPGRDDNAIHLTTAHGERITVRVTEVTAWGQVRIGFEAPKSVQIVRQKVLDREARQ